MRISCVQMEVRFGAPEDNFTRAAALIEQAVAAEHPDAVVLPETFNTGFFPREHLDVLAEGAGPRTRALFGPLARRLGVHIVAGSVADRRGSHIYNTAYVFDRTGACAAVYDKAHRLSPLGEDKAFAPGDRLCRFTLDGVRCGLLICYDVRFPEAARTLALGGLDILFVVSQWPARRAFHLRTLLTARAIENQCFTVGCNACSQAGPIVFGGGSVILDPWGRTLAECGPSEDRCTADCDPRLAAEVRAALPVFADRRPTLYRI